MSTGRRTGPGTPAISNRRSWSALISFIVNSRKMRKIYLMCRDEIARQRRSFVGIADRSVGQECFHHEIEAAVESGLDGEFDSGDLGQYLGGECWVQCL